MSVRGQPCGDVAAGVLDVWRVRQAAARIAPLIARTPIVTSATIDSQARRELFFKCEFLQTTGSFKLRGALNAMARNSLDTQALGVLTASSGNFAAALAWVAGYQGATAHVVIPFDAPTVKRTSIKGLGAVIHTCRPELGDRERVCRLVGQQTGAVYISPHDDIDVIAGNGTVALEILDDVVGLDAVVAPIGGGGLISGIAIVMKALRPDVRVIAAEPAGAADAARSMKAGRLVEVLYPHTVADGLRVGLGRMTWPIVRDLVDEVVVVADTEIVRAMQLIGEQLGFLVEPSAAIGLAAILSENSATLGSARKVAVVLSGGNIDPELARNASIPLASCGWR